MECRNRAPKKVRALDARLPDYRPPVRLKPAAIIAVAASIFQAKALPGSVRAVVVPRRARRERPRGRADHPPR